MSIRINKDKCIGCKRCISVCPGSLISLNSNKKAKIIRYKDCWGCTSCIKECPVYAIEFFLGADMGGNGATMHTEQKGDILNWIIDKQNKERVTIKVNKKEANKY